MSVSRFKFVSPGISLKEIDKSKTPTESTAVGPVVIGRSLRGPGMRPVKVQSYADFVELFGEADPGVANGDIWRNGSNLAPTYGAYAAKAYLANNGPLTFVRLLGVQNENPETSGYAGWSLSGSAASTIGANGGAFGLFVLPVEPSAIDAYAATSSAGVGVTGSLAAIFYLNEGSIGLVGKPLKGSSDAVFGSASVIVRSDNVSSPLFRIAISNKTNAAPVTASFNFTTTDQKFIRNVFNTNPTLINSRVTPATSLKTYFLGETFESNLPSISVSGTYAAVILALQSGSVNAGTFTKSAKESETGWIVGQHKGVNTDFVANGSGEYPVQKLFKFVSLTEGEWNQNNIKISISDIKPSPTNYEKYGTFTVTIRKMEDDDQNAAPIEVYTGLNLNPNSPNYIAARIGDVYTVWDPDKKLYKEYNTNPNISKFVRVEMDPVCASNDQDLLPFGFYGPSKFYTTPTYSGSVAVGLGTGVLSASLSASYFPYGAVVNAPEPANNKIMANNDFIVALSFPELPTVNTASATTTVDSDSTANSLEKSYWGLKTRLGTTKLVNQEVKETLRTLPYNVSSNSLTYSFLFSLDDVEFSGAANNVSIITNQTASVAYWNEGSRATNKSYTSKTAADLNSVYFQKIARFTVPLVGGFDGFDITEKEPFSEGSTTSPLAAGDYERTSYAYNSINRAIDAVTDSETVEMNLITVPGIQNVRLTNKLIEVCEQRADALAIIDLDGDFKSAQESKTTAGVEERPVASEVIAANMKNRAINSSYGCAFYPGVLAKDTSANVTLSLPASVVALGVMGSSAAATDVWFAPAGFTRGGLSNGAAGFPVVGVKSKLTSADRDTLYAVNVNPIASFPAEGIVVFGQKTLQVTPSSLDRINVRRLMIYVKKEISRFASTLLFDPNNEVTWARFTGQVVPFLQDVKARFGLTDFKVILDSTTTTPELVDRNILYAKIFLKPARAIEFIALDFILTNTGASFDD